MAIDIRKSISIRPNPANYIMDEPLRKAVEVALAFNQPLLLTGEPGTGKTLLAYKVAAELHEQTKDWPLQKSRFAANPLRFNTKTDSVARDLFYTYDAIGHFQQANLNTGGPASLLDFLELQALGTAIANTNPQMEYNEYFRWQRPTYPESSVVLIDEIDKAPRDFTNDILNEIERREFFIKEQRNYRVAIGEDNPQRMLIIMTSNSEKNLPDAFLRRCVFYSIPFPDAQRLQDILEAQLEAPLNAPARTTSGRSSASLGRSVTGRFAKNRLRPSWWLLQKCWNWTASWASRPARNTTNGTRGICLCS